MCRALVLQGRMRRLPTLDYSRAHHALGSMRKPSASSTEIDSVATLDCVYLGIQSCAGLFQLRWKRPAITLPASTARSARLRATHPGLSLDSCCGQWIWQRRKRGNDTDQLLDQRRVSAECNWHHMSVKHMHGTAITASSHHWPSAGRAERARYTKEKLTRTQHQQSQTNVLA